MVMFDVTWPNVYLSYLEYFTFVKFDIFGMLGIECVGNGFLDYRAKVGLACSVPVLVVLVGVTLYKIRVHSVSTRTKRDANVRTTAVEYMFDTVDTDGSMEIV